MDQCFRFIRAHAVADQPHFTTARAVRVQLGWVNNLVAQTAKAGGLGSEGREVKIGVACHGAADVNTGGAVLFGHGKPRYAQVGF